MITKEIKYFYYDLLRQRIDFFTTPLTDKNINLVDDKHKMCFDEEKSRSTGGEYNTRSVAGDYNTRSMAGDYNVRSEHTNRHSNTHNLSNQSNDEKNMEAFNAKKII